MDMAADYTQKALNDTASKRFKSLVARQFLDDTSLAFCSRRSEYDG
jgi:hypothetical protein